MREYKLLIDTVKKLNFALSLRLKFLEAVLLLKLYSYRCYKEVTVEPEKNIFTDGCTLN
jgi:hypothetical protein